MNTKDLGARGEDLAAAFLEDLGYRIMERNYRFDRGEVDLVCFQPHPRYEEGGELVFVEVKTRTGTGFGRPEEAVDSVKQQTLVWGAKAYLYERRLEGSPCRFDVVSILLRGEDEPEIEHFVDAFWAP